MCREVSVRRSFLHVGVQLSRALCRRDSSSCCVIFTTGWRDKSVSGDCVASTPSSTSGWPSACGLFLIAFSHRDSFVCPSLQFLGLPSSSLFWHFSEDCLGIFRVSLDLGFFDVFSPPHQLLLTPKEVGRSHSCFRCNAAFPRNRGLLCVARSVGRYGNSWDAEVCAGRACSGALMAAVSGVHSPGEAPLPTG